MNNVKSNNTKTNLSEVIFYLEELYSMDMLNIKEEYIYERYKWEHKMKKSDLSYLHKRMKEWCGEQF